MFPFALVSPMQRMCDYLLPDVILDWDPSVPSTTTRSHRQFVFPTRSGSLLFNDMTDVSADVGEQEDDDDQRTVFGLIS